jgi:sugar lactone lactonase YvrE
VVDADGVIYLTDLENYRLLALSPDLERLWQYGEPAFTPEEHNARLLDSPSGITLDGEGNIFLTDMLSSQVLAFTTAGVPIGDRLGEHGRADDQFFYPKGIEWMEDDLFVLADRFNDRIVAVRLTPQVDE